MHSHWTFSVVQMCTSGCRAWRSSQVAIDTAIRAGGPLGSANIRVPHRAQDLRRIRGELGQSVVSPVQAKASRAKIARAKNGPPVASRQRQPWETRTFA